VSLHGCVGNFMSRLLFQGKLFAVNPADPATNSYAIASWWFIRCIALIYFAAFYSLSGQVTGLVGSNGILPAQFFLQNAEAQLGDIAWLRVPTLFWLDASDTSLVWACYTGMALSMLLLIGKAQLVVSIGLFGLYLSLFHVGQTFLNFQWDYLLLEAGFLSILLIWNNNRIVIFLFHWLLFRLRFLSGISKLQDPSWLNLTTLNHYFETQPLPHLGAWYFHQLPDWLLRTGTGFTLFVELIVPFFIFLPRRFRLFAAFSTIFLQLLIIASSNHNWINLLTIVLCLFLLDDRALNFLKRIKPTAIIETTHKKAGMLVSAFFGILIVSTSIAITAQFFVHLQAPNAFFWTRAWGLGNVYHVFPTMQLDRYEFSIEGSYDGKQWKQYLFKYKPNHAQEVPPFIVPHQPRLDWMIWFVPSKEPAMKFWFDAFIYGLHRNEPAITALLKYNPFEGQPAPRFMRVLTYDYEFTNIEEFKETGNYWNVSYLGDFPFVPARRP